MALAMPWGYALLVLLLRPFYVLSFPWALWERIAATHYWFALPVAALGIDAAARYAWRALNLGTKRVGFVALVAAPIVAVGLLLPLCVSAWRANVYASASRITSESDMGALLWLGGHGSSNLQLLTSLILTGMILLAPDGRFLLVLDEIPYWMSRDESLLPGL